MGCGAAVGIHNNLAAGQAGIPRGAADDKPPGGIDEDPGVFRNQFMGNHRQDHLLDDVRAQFVLIGVRSVLGGNNYGVNRHRLIILVGNGHLGLAIGIQIRQCAVLADLCQPQGQAMAQGDRQGHLLRGFVAGIAEHHPLVAGADVFLVLSAAGLKRVVDAHGDVRALVMDRGHHSTGMSVKGFFGAIIADIRHGLADNGIDVHIGRGCNLTHDGDHAG